MRLLHIDDHPMFRKAVIQTLKRKLKDKVECLEAGSCNEAIELENPGNIDIILLDLGFPGFEDLDALSMIDEYFECKIVLFTSEDNPDVIRRALQRDIAGYIPKSYEADDLIDALRLISRGHRFIPEEFLRSVDSIPHDARSAGNNPGEELRETVKKLLTPRQFEVYRLVVAGMVYKKIATELSIDSENTIKSHMANCRKRLQKHGYIEATYSNNEAIRFALMNNLFPDISQV